MSKESTLSRLRSLNDSVRNTDGQLVEEVMDLSGQPGPKLQVEGADIDVAIAEESIIMRRFRPVLAIKENETVLEFNDPAEGTLWRDRLLKAAPLLSPAIRSVGRIDLSGASLRWVGTGWLVAENIVVTNRHVAEVFVARAGAGFSFKVGAGGAKVGASMDFLQEIGSERQLVFKLLRPLYVAPVGDPDVSLFEIEIESGDHRLAQPIRLASKPVTTNEVAVIGYPAYDSRIPDPALMESLFGRVYDKKRLAPGAVTRVDALRLEHNCTTLGGNSGSTVVGLDTGEALGLHFSGSFLTTNYAVRSDVVARLVSDVRNGVMPESGSVRRPAPSRSSAPAPSVPQRSVSVTIPLTVTVTVGDAVLADGRSRPPRQQPTDDVEEDGETGTEAMAEDYRDREGYQAKFLGAKHVVELPSVVDSASDVVELENGVGSELKYQHFSVVMNRKRRMCFFSAVNIDGGQSKKSARVGWKWDPRLPRNLQIMAECYGNPPKFSRGHMTRREDPGWGDAKAAKRGNEDSMHVTNVTPQMQAFNSPIWLALEDYALQHAREDEMKISVFTGPYFRRADPTMYGVKIPVAFWKVIAFLHDETGKLCATGYEMTQKDDLPEEEFVYGSFVSPQLRKAVQIPIRSIERKSGLSFGRLSDFDPLQNDNESVSLGEDGFELESIEQVRFM